MGLRCTERERMRLTPELINAIGERAIRESGVTFHPYNGNPHAISADNEVYTADPTTLDQLFDLFHEIGHCVLKHDGSVRGRTRHREEYEAEQYAIKEFERLGLPECTRMKDSGDYVASAIGIALKNNLDPKNIDPEALAWSGYEYRQAFVGFRPVSWLQKKETKGVA